MDTGHREEDEFKIEFEPLLTTLDDPNDFIPAAFDFAHMVRDPVGFGLVAEDDLRDESKRSKFDFVHQEQDEDLPEPKRNKRSKKDASKTQDFGQCDRCRKHGQQCDNQKMCAYCDIGGYVCERLPDKKIVVPKKKSEPPQPSSNAQLASFEEAPRCENCRRGHRKCNRKVPCQECVSRGLECNGGSSVAGGSGSVSSNAVAASSANARKKEEESSGSRNGGASSGDGDFQLPCQECRSLHRRCDRKIPCSSCAARGTSCSLQSESPVVSLKEKRK